MLFGEIQSQKHIYTKNIKNQTTDLKIKNLQKDEKNVIT